MTITSSLDAVPAPTPAPAPMPAPEPAAGPAPVIVPNRRRLDNRFPVLAFTISTQGRPWFEVLLTTDRSLFDPAAAARRTPANFYAGRQDGGLARAGAEDTAYVVPAAVLKRFADARPRPSEVFYTVAAYDTPESPPVFAHPPAYLAATAPSVLLGADFAAHTMAVVLGVPAEKLRPVDDAPPMSYQAQVSPFGGAGELDDEGFAPGEAQSWSSDDDDEEAIAQAEEAWSSDPAAMALDEPELAVEDPPPAIAASYEPFPADEAAEAEAAGWDDEAAAAYGAEEVGEAYADDDDVAEAYADDGDVADAYADEPEAEAESFDDDEDAGAEGMDYGEDEAQSVDDADDDERGAEPMGYEDDRGYDDEPAAEPLAYDDRGPESEGYAAEPLDDDEPEEPAAGTAGLAYDDGYPDDDAAAAQEAWAEAEESTFPAGAAEPAALVDADDDRLDADLAAAYDAPYEAAPVAYGHGPTGNGAAAPAPPAAPAPALDIPAKVALLRKVARLHVPEGYSAAAIDARGALRAGLVGFRGRLLTRLLEMMRTRDAAGFRSIFGDAAALPATADTVTRLRQAGAHPPFQAAQNELAVRVYLDPVLPLAAGFGIGTERGVALAVDLALQLARRRAAEALAAALGPVRTDAERQQALGALGLPGIAEFQRAAGLPPDGTFGPVVHAHLAAALRRLGAASPLPLRTTDQLLDALVAQAGRTLGPAAEARARTLRTSPEFGDAPLPGAGAPATGAR